MGRGGKKLLTREAILAAEDRAIVEFEVPEWGGFVKIKPLSLRGRAKILEASREKDEKEVDPVRFTAQVFIAGVVEPAFTEEDLEALGDKNAAPIDRVSNEILQLSGIDVKALARARGNF